MALKHGAMGDCMVNLNKNDDALSQFEKAISASDDEYTSYYFTRKAGMLAIVVTMLLRESRTLFEHPY